MKVYISHPYGGKRANLEHVEELIVGLYKKYPSLKAHSYLNSPVCMVSPIHALGFLYDEVDYDMGMKLCYALIDGCDFLVYREGEISEGVKRELAYCERNNIPIVEWKDFETLLAIRNGAMT